MANDNVEVGVVDGLIEDLGEHIDDRNDLMDERNSTTRELFRSIVDGLYTTA